MSEIMRRSYWYANYYLNPVLSTGVGEKTQTSSEIFPRILVDWIVYHFFKRSSTSKVSNQHEL